MNGGDAKNRDAASGRRAPWIALLTQNLQLTTTWDEFFLRIG
jgi:hypothetical protein